MIETNPECLASIPPAQQPSHAGKINAANTKKIGINPQVDAKNI
jgi:hypothetical protein